MGRLATSSVLVLIAAVVGPVNAAMAGELTLEAQLAQLPKSDRCNSQLRWVTAEYRVLRVVSGNLSSPTVLVVHACPQRPRGFNNAARGDAGPLRPGQRHRLRLRRLEQRPTPLVDRFAEHRPRYQAIWTAPLPWPKRLLVAVTGLGRNHRIPFDQHRVTIGSGDDVDIRIDGSQARHVSLIVDGEQILLQSHAPVGLNGKRVARGTRRLRQSDRLQIASYQIRAALAER